MWKANNYISWGNLSYKVVFIKSIYLSDLNKTKYRKHCSGSHEKRWDLWALWAHPYWVGKTQNWPLAKLLLRNGPYILNSWSWALHSTPAWHEILSSLFQCSSLEFLWDRVVLGKYQQIGGPQVFPGAIIYPKSSVYQNAPCCNSMHASRACYIQSYQEKHVACMGSAGKGSS